MNNLIMDSKTPTSTVCRICAELHPITQMCKYDRLTKVALELRLQNQRGSQAYEQLIDTAKIFQNMIRQMTPRLEQIDSDFELLIKIISSHPGGAEIINTFNEKRVLIGKQDVQAATSQGDDKIVQPEAEIINVRRGLEEVPNKVSEIK